MNIARHATMGLLILVGSSVCHAWDIDVRNNTVTVIGSHTPSKGFATFKEGIHTNCSHQHLYFDISTDAGKAFFSTLTAAKAGNIKVRIAYNVPETPNSFTLELLALD